MVAFQRQRVMNIGASSSAWTSRLAHGVGIQVARDFLEREAVRGRQRQDDRVLGRGRLQLEIELAAEALAQRQAPGAIDAAAETGEWMTSCVPPVSSKKRSITSVSCDGSRPSAGLRAAQVVDDLRGRDQADADFIDQIIQREFRVVARRASISVAGARRPRTLRPFARALRPARTG